MGYFHRSSLISQRRRLITFWLAIPGYTEDLCERYLGAGLEGAVIRTEGMVGKCFGKRIMESWAEKKGAKSESA